MDEEPKPWCSGWGRGKHRVDRVEPIADEADLLLCDDCKTQYAIDKKTGQDSRAHIKEHVAARSEPRKADKDE
jgi:hypothetical protein